MLQFIYQKGFIQNCYLIERTQRNEYLNRILDVNYVMNIDTPINSLWLIGKVQM